jgi:hypothetical protein
MEPDSSHDRKAAFVLTSSVYLSVAHTTSKAKPCRNGLVARAYPIRHELMRL